MHRAGVNVYVLDCIGFHVRFGFCGNSRGRFSGFSLFVVFASHETECDKCANDYISHLENDLILKKMDKFIFISQTPNTERNDPLSIWQ